MNSDSHIDWESLKTHVNGTDLYFVEELAKQVPYISIGELRVKTDIEYDAPYESNYLVPEGFARYGIHNDKVLKGCMDLIQLCNEHLIVGESVGVEHIKELDGEPVKLLWAIRKAERGSTDYSIELIIMMGLAGLSAYPGLKSLLNDSWTALQWSIKAMGNDLPALKENKDLKDRIEPTFGILETSDSIDKNQSIEESKELAVREYKARYQAKVLNDGTTAYIPSPKSLEDKNND